jgi:hypothetical protein
MAGLAWRGAFAAIALLTLAAAPAAAADSSSSAASEEQSSVPEELQTMVGDFVLAQEDDSLPTCPIRFTDRDAAGGWAVEMPETCPAPYPTADQIAAWNVDDADGSVVLLDADRKVVMRLFEDEDGLFDTDPNIEPRFYLLAPYDEDGSGGEADSD